MGSETANTGEDLCFCQGFLLCPELLNVYEDA
jgi:hypothetical protein